MSTARTSSARVVRKSPTTPRTENTDIAATATGGLETPRWELMARSARRIQNTHWYRAGWSSYSANPHTAPESEIRRVGLHSCQARNCPEEHSWNAEEYYRLQLLKQWAEEGFY